MVKENKLKLARWWIPMQWCYDEWLRVSLEAIISDNHENSWLIELPNESGCCCATKEFRRI